MSAIVLRPVTAGDSRVLWVWRNDSETRRNSIFIDEVPLEQHEAWLAASLRNSSRIMRMAEVDGGARGVVRFDRIADEPNLWRISVMIDPTVRGRGLGRAALAMACDEMETRFSGCRFHAEIRTENVSSRRIFDACGFTEIERADGFATLRRGPATADEK